MASVAVYCRVSSEEQASAGTIDNQRDYARRFCDLNSLKIAAEYLDDGVSGTVPLSERQAGRRLLADAKAHKFDTVLVYRIDRLARKIKILLDSHEQLEAAGVTLRSMTEPIDTSSPIGRFVFQLIGSIAELERETILERMQLGTNRAARDGRWLGGITPYGYRIQDGRLVVSTDPIPGLELSEGDVVRLCYAKLLEGWTCPKLADYLNALGVPPAYKRDNRTVGKRAEHTAGVWYPSRIRNMLVEPTYYGVHRYGERSRKAREVIEREVPAIVSRETWEAVRARIASNQIMQSNVNSKREYLLRGLIVCERCGCHFHGAPSGPKSPAYYRCNGRQAYRSRIGRTCLSPSVDADQLESAIWEQIVAYINDPGEALALLSEQYRVRLESKATATEASETIQKALDKKQRERDVVVRLLRQEAITYDEGVRQLSEIEREVKLLEAERERAFAQVADAVDAERLLIEAGMLLESLRERVAVADSATKREVIQKLVKEVRVSGERGAPVVTVTYAFAAVIPKGKPAENRSTAILQASIATAYHRATSVASGDRPQP